MKAFLLTLLTLAITGCSTVNHVTVLTPEHAVIKHDPKPGLEDRFSNLYRQKPDYPDTCKQDCYPPHPALVCQSSMENCQFKQPQTIPDSNTGFTAAELNCKVMIPWGYGNASWKMGDHSSHSALFRLLNMHKRLANKVPLYILNEGESIKL